MTIGEKLRIYALRAIYHKRNWRVFLRCLANLCLNGKMVMFYCLRQNKELCALFKVTADELIDDNIVIHRGRKIELPDENIKPNILVQMDLEAKLTNNLIPIAPIRLVASSVGFMVIQNIRCKRSVIAQKSLLEKTLEDLPTCLNTQWQQVRPRAERM